MSRQPCISPANPPKSVAASQAPQSTLSTMMSSHLHLTGENIQSPSPQKTMTATKQLSTFGPVISLKVLEQTVMPPSTAGACKFLITYYGRTGGINGNAHYTLALCHATVKDPPTTTQSSSIQAVAKQLLRRTRFLNSNTYLVLLTDCTITRSSNINNSSRKPPN